MNNDIFSGKTLKTVLEKRGRLEPMDLLYIMKSAAEELARLHQSGKIHGNIKPETVLISTQRWFCYSLPEKNGRLAAGYLPEQNETEKKAVWSRLSESAVLPFQAESDGDNYYTPLEVYVDRNQIGPWSDVYSLCAVMYTALTGQPIPSISEWICGANMKSPSELGIKNVPPYLEDALSMGLCMRRKDRLQNGMELYQMLRDKKKIVSQMSYKHPDQMPISTPSSHISSKKNRPKARRQTEQIRYFGIKRAKKIFRDGLPQIIRIPDKTDVILSNAFQSVVFPQKLVKVRQIILPESVREIQDHAFWQLEAEETIVVPDRTEQIGTDAFRMGESAYIICHRGTRIYEYCQKKHLRTSVDMDDWRNAGLCQYCGGQISFIWKNCKICGRPKDY